MTAAEQGDDKASYGFVLADDGLGDFGPDTRQSGAN